MDNFEFWENDVAYKELPYEETLVRLYELRDRYEGATAASIASSASERHRARHGHRLSYGCCRDIAHDVAELDQDDKALYERITAYGAELLRKSTEPPPRKSS